MLKGGDFTGQQLQRSYIIFLLHILHIFLRKKNLSELYLEQRKSSLRPKALALLQKL